jgi:4-hydroxy-3-polyprenylbenzoate decarboxylase
MAPPGDLRDWIALLEREGELVRVSAEVDPHLEITEITDRVVKAGGPALLFENPKGSEHPLLINQFGTERRMCLAFGADSLDEVGRRLGDVLEMQPPQGLAEKVRGLKKLKSIADSQPKRVRSGPVQEVVLEGDEVDLSRLPVQTCWPGDAAPFITLPAVITTDPRTGGRNVGMYRLQKYDATSTGLHWQIHKDAAADWRDGAGRMEVAISIGSDPITAYSGSCPAPKHVDELMVAGFLRGKPVEVVQCKTVDLQVPARAEIVLEGYCERGELADEGPFGDHTGYYTPAEPFPVLRLTCMTMRRDAIYPSILVGPPPAEDAWLGKATERLFLPALRATLPELVDYDLPVAGAFHNCCIISIRKAYPGHARKVMHAVWGTGLLSLTKMVIVVDEWVDVHDYGEVAWQVGANTDPGRDVEQAHGPLDQLDHAPSLQALGGKLGLDATATWPGEGYPREWPEVARMSDEVRRQVDERWESLGIALPPAAARAARRGRRGWRRS